MASSLYASLNDGFSAIRSATSKSAMGWVLPLAAAHVARATGRERSPAGLGEELESRCRACTLTWDPHKSPVGEQALKYFAALYEVEREAHLLESEDRRRLRQEKAMPITNNFRAWLEAQRVRVPDGSATAKAIDYSLGRWAALTRYLNDGDVPCDNNWVENQIRPIAIGRSNWLFAGSLRAGKRAAAIMSLIHSARLNGHDPYAYLRDVMERLPTQPAARIDQLLPHCWTIKRDV